MAIGAKDIIDKLLVEKYSSEKVDNHDEDALISRVNANDMMTAMNATADHYKTMFQMQKKLSTICYGVVAKSARYTKFDEENAA